MSFSIRRLTRDDVEAYRAVRLEALINHPDAYASTPESFAARSNDDVAAMLDRLAIFGVMTESGDIGGIVAYSRDDGEREIHRGWLLQVYVKPALRGTGAARALLDMAIEHARTEVIQLHLMVASHNTPAIRRYEQAGFTIYGTDPRCLLVNGRYIDEHMMVRFLDEAPGKNPNV